MIEQGFNYADSSIKEMTDFFETRVENMEPKEDRKNLQQFARKTRNFSRKGKGKTPTPVSQSPAKNQLKLAVQPGNTASYTENAVILQTIARIYVQQSTSTNRKRGNLRKKQQKS